MRFVKKPFLFAALALIAALITLVAALSFEIFWQYQLPHRSAIEEVAPASSDAPTSSDKPASNTPAKDAPVLASDSDAPTTSELVQKAKDADIRILFKKGWNLRQISQELERKGAVRYGYFFELVARAFFLDGSLQAGEYMLAERSSLYDILRLLLSGRTIRYSITVPEGLTFYQISELLLKTEHLTGEALPSVAEGYLLADTYFYRRGDHRASIILRMERAMRDTLRSAWFSERSAISRKFLRSKHDILTLASLVERETGVAAERAKVAGVFYNRLARGMKLQTDPTLVYWESDKRGVLGRGLRRSELRRDHPYNTYIHAGLPPTPIANPGRASILAVLHPASNDYLYFVADGTGGHRFAKTFSEHLRNVRIWRGVESARKSRDKSNESK